MQYDAKTPEEYFELLEEDWRKEKVLEIRKMIMEYGPELEEGILYKMLVYGDSFGLNAQKWYVSLYVGSIDKIEGADELLKAFDLGKGCIRIRKTTDLSKTGLEAFIRKTIDMSRTGGDTTC
ncbi:MAG TPA: DUF1801 domain-containing protein [Clostridiaceae bacterium]|nr:DUF1801 domain-containing protein [Clostridiaceae bacterium]